MNVKGINADGRVSQLQIAAQNESVTAMAVRFTKAMAEFPSSETEHQLETIIQEAGNTTYENQVKFQCCREISKSKIAREEFAEAIPWLVQSLKQEETRTDIWAQLALCAQKTNNANLFLAATSRLKSIRPQFTMDMAPPRLPALEIPKENLQPEFVGYEMPNACWKLFMMALQDAMATNPYGIPEFIFQGQASGHSQPRAEWDISRPVNVSHKPFQGTNEKPQLRLGGLTIPEFIIEYKLIAKERDQNPGTWTFAQPVIIVVAEILNCISQLLTFTEKCKREIATRMIAIACEYKDVLKELTPSTRLFLTELASIDEPDKCGMLMFDINSAHLHSQHTLTRMSFAILEESIRNNLNWEILEKQMRACRNNLLQPLELRHSGVTINEEMLAEKEKQVLILQFIQNDSGMLAPGVVLFRDLKEIDFLSLKNKIELILKFDEERLMMVLPAFIKGLPEFIKKSPQEVNELYKVFDRIQGPMGDQHEFLQNLDSIMKMLEKVSAKPELIFSVAMAYARASDDSPEQRKKLANIHTRLGKLGVCHLNNGAFLEKLLEVLIPYVDEDESEKDVTAAFTCYFNDCPLTNIRHRSDLKFGCSRFVQAYYNHVVRLDEKEKGTQNLSGPYFAIWKHSHGDCNCIEEIDGWRMYKSVKKREALLTRMGLPEGWTSQDVLEDMLRNDHSNSPECKIALAKVLIRSFVQSGEPDPKYLHEASALLSEGDFIHNPRIHLNRCIADALLNRSPAETADMLTQLGAFSEEKAECRRLYWTMRTLVESDQIERAKPYAVDALNMCKGEKAPKDDFSLQLISMAAQILRDNTILKQKISSYPKGRILSPYPHLLLARASPADKAFKIISELVRSNSMNIVNFFHFEFKPGFLMARPDDSNTVRHDVLQTFIDSAAASGNYLKLFALFNPSNKLDQKVSKVMTRTRYVYDIDRYDIFETYVRELTKVVHEKMSKKGLDGPTTDRVFDALVRGRAIEQDGAISLKYAIDSLFAYAWKDIAGQDPTPEATLDELMNLYYNNGEEDDDDDEEEDRDFVDDEEEDGDSQTDGNNEEDSEGYGSDDTASESDEGSDAEEEEESMTE